MGHEITLKTWKQQLENEMEQNDMKQNSKYQKAFQVARGRMSQGTCGSVMNVMCVLEYEVMTENRFLTAGWVREA